MDFGIDEKVEATRGGQFKGGIHKAFLLEVSVDTKTSKKDESTYKVLSFKFSDPDNTRKFEHVEWVPKSDEPAKAQKALEAFNKRVKHIYETYAKFPAGKVGGEAKSWEEYFEAIAKIFNEGAGGKPVHRTDKGGLIMVWVKLTFNNTDNLGFPYSPNFIDLVKVDKDTTLLIDKRYDRVEQAGSNSGSNAGGGHNDIITHNAADVDEFFK